MIGAPRRTDMAKRTEDRTVLERNEMLNEAIRFAVEAHAGQLRKG